MKKGLESSKLPLTKDSVILHVYRAKYQCYIWKNVQRPFLSLLFPVENGWIKPGGGNLEPALMTNLPAPENLIELTVCQCRKNLFTTHATAEKPTYHALSHLTAENSV